MPHRGSNCQASYSRLCSSAFLQQGVTIPNVLDPKLEGDGTLFALILETLSTTELLFILVIALIFFGPRKLPQLARQLERVSPTFAKLRKISSERGKERSRWKRRELESEAHRCLIWTPISTPAQHPTTEAMVEPPDPELVVPRDGSTPATFEQTVSASDSDDEKNSAANSQKHDWL